ncbi:SIS domain-containing protein [Weissella paramesenteroides]|uniref:SIS domain-containing protein n=1 Tax=Weissella paramesenteroides TaxID=1249 RepID=A0ABD4XKM2_WEIPA|nr:6-phospho-3-hexuloisomerase [Weissella paramesenteroides]MDF8367444.1 SIS domain-containing protein [Weissella paramesenteroides]MDF8369672.1 SIS domain-containing protein [Weissella paramesenteroides]MDF8371760.1 SIS domain-containing protein [Weissella paramesenteroides]MDF8374442.1 SIS domain-containing protein [Weissella paramesenteroides]
MNWASILHEISNNSDRQISNKLLELTHSTNRIFLTGSGRSGLALKGFAMRLSQLGKCVFFVGETNTPAIEPEDLLIIASSSGETSQLINYADIAKNIGANVWLWSTNTNNTIYEKSNHVTLLSGKSKFANSDLTQQPMGSLFEQSVWIYGDLFVINYMNYYNIPESELKQRHANLE